MDIKRAVPVSRGSYSGTCVSAAPAFEPAVMSFNVPVTERVIVVAQTEVTTCTSSHDCTDCTAPLCGEVMSFLLRGKFHS